MDGCPLAEPCASWRSAHSYVDFAQRARNAAVRRADAADARADAMKDELAADRAKCDLLAEQLRVREAEIQSLRARLGEGPPCDVHA